MLFCASREDFGSNFPKAGKFTANLGSFGGFLGKIPMLSVKIVIKVREEYQCEFSGIRSEFLRKW